MAGTTGQTNAVMKWVGIATAVISLILGGRQVYLMIQEAAERRGKVAGLTAEAERLAASGEFISAWQSAARAVELDPGAVRLQANIGMQWLREARVSSGGHPASFAEITQTVLPVLYRVVDTTERSRAATIIAHIGWAGYLRFKEGERGMQVGEQFARALLLDSTNCYAHVMAGFWDLFPGHGALSVPSAERHFSRALLHGGDSVFVRSLIVYAYENCPAPGSHLRALRAVNDMRVAGDPLGEAIRGSMLSDLYSMYLDNSLSAIDSLLTPRQQLDTFTWVTDGIDIADRPYLRDILARLKRTVGEEGR